MKSNDAAQSFDVIIAGAGPVGLFLACELALAKCSVLVLEKATDPVSPLKQVPFGVRGLSANSIEAMDRRGMLAEFELHKRFKSPHQNSGQSSSRPGGHFAGIQYLEADIDVSQFAYRLPSSTATGLISEMQEVEGILLRRAESLGVEIRRGFSINDFQPEGDEVRVRSNEQSFRGRWLVGCDGARSVVRKQGGFDFAGTEPEFTGYSVRADLLDPEKLRPGRNVTPTGMYMQSQPGYLMLQDFDGGAFHASGAPIAREHAQEVLRRISGTDVTITTLHIATAWTDRARQATTYRKGRLLLAGDAAHIHSPLGGQGLNLGLGDAMNLGWKLAAVIQGQGSETLLETYETERHPLGEQVLDWSRAQVAIMKTTPEARALRSIFADLVATRDGATYFAGRVSGVNMRYDLGDDHPLVGRSVPNFEFSEGVRVGDLMHDGRGLLIDFAGSSELRALADPFGDRLQFVTGHFHQQFNLRSVLVRPDGIVAWVAQGEPDSATLRLAIGLWFGAGLSQVREP